MSSSKKGTLRSSHSIAYWSIAIMIALTIAAWVPYFLNKPFVLNKDIMKEWGQVPYPPEGPYRVGVTAIGNRLLSYQSEYRLAAVCFHQDGTKDPMDIPDLQKSELYDIRDEDMRIVITPDTQFMQLVEKGARGTNYSLLLVPKGIHMKQFSTMREATVLGVIKLPTSSGPP